MRSMFTASATQPNPATFAWFKFIRDQRWSRKQKQELLSLHDTPEAIYKLGLDVLAPSLLGLSKQKQDRSSAGLIEQDMQWLNAPDNTLITILDSDYPELLRQVDDPPLALFASGNIELLNQPKVAIVGSRQPTPIGAKITRELSQGLAELGLVITSGMALGVDALAHNAALDCAEPTIAVLGCGIDIVYPQRHRDLYARIKQNGLVLSEYPLGSPPHNYHFPQRNRIVSGLCFGVVILEAADRSGTLITARLAAEQNREVMVVPGSSLSKQYIGSHRLLQQGAALVSSTEDVLRELAPALQNQLTKTVEPARADVKEYDLSLTAIETEESQLLQYIAYESTSIDQVILASGLTTAKVSAMLLSLELSGLVAVAPDGGFVNLS